MLMYLLKSGACLAILLLFYQLFLERESIHVFKRYYLLAALALSFVVPAIVFVEYIEIEPVPEMYTAGAQVTEAPEIAPIEMAIDYDMFDPVRIFGAIYVFGVLLFGYKFYRNLLMIVQRIRKNTKYKVNAITKVLLKERIAPHTFFSYIFLNREKFTSNQIPHAVLLHEEAHAKQKHSLDVLIIEVLQVIFWFNPLIFLTKRCIKLNHEFLADQAVVAHGVATDAYQHILLAFSSNALAPQFSNSIHYSSIKKRFTVMKTKTSKKSFLLRTLLLLPLLTVLLFGFSETKIILTEAVLNMEPIEPNEAVTSFELKGATKEELAAYNALAKKYNKQPKESRVVPNSDLKILENIYGKMSSEQKEAALAFPECSPNQDGASREEMAEYNKLAKYYNAMPKNKMKILKKDVERLEYIYALMSDTQKTASEPFPVFPDPPPPPKAPKEPKEVIAPNMMKGEKSNIPPPSPPNAVAIAHNKVIIVNENVHVETNIEENEILDVPSKPASPHTTAKTKGSRSIAPPPPLAPENPIDHIVSMGKKGAIFYHENKEISTDEAIELLKTNNHINVETKHIAGNKPIVKLTTRGIGHNK